MWATKLMSVNNGSMAKSGVQLVYGQKAKNAFHILNGWKD